MATISSSTNFTVGNSSSYDGDMVVKNFESLTINNGVTVSSSNPCKGMLIFVQGNCTINGTLTCHPSQGSFTGLPSSLTYPVITSGGSSLSNGDFTGMGATAPGVLTSYVNQYISGKTGVTFTLNRQGSNDNTAETGPGGYPGFASGCCFGQGAASRESGTAFGGGGGVGGSCGCHGTNPGQATRTQGGTGAAYGCHGQGGGGGGAGFPAGSGGQNAGNGSTATQNGVIWLIVGGNLTGSGTIQLSGAKGGTAGSGGYSGSGGGGSGGGACFIAVAGTNSFCSTESGASKSSHSGGTGTINIAGGTRGDGTSAGSGGGCYGIAGEDGYVQVIAMT